MTDFAADFPPARREDWLALVEKVLKGQPFDRLQSKTYDALTIEPLYERAASAQPVLGRRPGGVWQIVQRIDHPDPAAANAEALQDLVNGATALSLVFVGSVGAYGHGLDGSESAISRALESVHLDAGISLELDLSPQTKDAGAQVARLVKQRKLAPDQTDIRFGFDPIGAMTMVGGSPFTWAALAPIFYAAVDTVASQGFRGPFAVADGRVVHNAGGSEAQELAFVLAVAVTYLRALESAGVRLDDARGMIFFRLSADADQFLTMAKLRALRKLWARVEETSGMAAKPIFLSAETAWRMMTARDPHVNMLRATMATFSAASGGANAISVLPFTAPLGLPDRFARRIARNTQLILLEESSLAKVSDPAAGSGGIEDLTAKLCARTWALFQEIERAGGAAAAIEQGLIQKNVAAVRAARERAIAERRELITGTTAFPHAEDVPISVLKATPVKLPDLPKAIEFAPLTPRRLAEPHESTKDGPLP